MAGVQEVPGEQSAPAPELDDEAVTLAHRCEQGRDSGCARVGMEPVPAVVDQREIVPVIGIVDLVHAPRVQFTPSCKTETMTRMMSTTLQNRAKYPKNSYSDV